MMAKKKIMWRAKCLDLEEGIEQRDKKIAELERAKVRADDRSSNYWDDKEKAENKVGELERQLKQAKEDRNYTADYYLKAKKEVEKDRDFYKSVCRAFGKLSATPELAKGGIVRNPRGQVSTGRVDGLMKSTWTKIDIPADEFDG